MQLLQSSKLSLPIIYLIEDDKELNSLPLGIPFMRGSKKDYNAYIRLLEFEVLYLSAKATGFPFNWRVILKENGFDVDGYEIRKLKNEVYSHDGELGVYLNDLGGYVEDISYIIDIEYLKSLRLLPTWFSDIEKAIKENILNTIVYNPTLYNKKLDLCIGDIDLNTPEKNLIIIDISSSIPKSISKSVLLLSKTMASSFYADLLITGSKSTLYDYTEIDKINVETIYNENGLDNDRVYFQKLVEQYRKYNNVIIFGDDDSPTQRWFNSFNDRLKKMTQEDGKRINKWEIKKIFSFHTKSEVKLAAYGDWFSCSEIEYMKKWVTYLD